MQLIPGTGHVLVRGPLVLVISGNTAAAQDANALVNQLHSSATWDFDSIAGILQELVTAHDLMGVAAVSLWGPEHILFLFDGAEAATDAGMVPSNGRDSWVTDVVDGDSIEIRLSGTRSMPPAHGTELRDGIVEGAGARLVLGGAPTAPTATTGAAGPMFAAPAAAPSPHVLPPPPPAGTVPPPPPRTSGLGRPTRVPPPAPPPPTPEQPR